MKKIKSFLLIAVFALLLFSFAQSALATGYNSVSQNANTAAEKKLLTARAVTAYESEDVAGVCATYAVDKASLAELETKYHVTFGAIVARADHGFSQAELVPTYDAAKNALTAPRRTVMLTVYSTAGKHPVNASFSDEKRTAFNVILDLGEQTVERTECGVVNVAFVLLEDPTGAEAPRIYTVARKGADYGTSPSFAAIKRFNYEAKREDATVQANYIDFQQKQMKSDVDMLSRLPVYVCGVDAEETLAEGERAIWVEYLEDKQPYPDGNTVAKRNIRAAYIYYPLDFDPTLGYEYDELVELGVTKRVFAYIGTPDSEEKVPGLVCVHGGGGHAYAEYALEAVMNGYAAIAIDTEGYYNKTGGTTKYSPLDASYTPDTSFGHKPKDSFANAEKSLQEQWLYYAVYDTALANTVLRSMEGVDADAVGITGISWGGLITSTAICYDHRYAFAAPIYISFHMAESYGISVGGLPNKPFAAALWQDAELLKKSPVPTLIISSEHDLFASVDTVSKSANDLPNGTLLLKPNLTHGQQFGAALPEIYRFGYSVMGKEGGFVTAKESPTAEMGRTFTLHLEIPADLSNVKATLNYRTEPFKQYSDITKFTFTQTDLTVNADGSVNVVLPENTTMYYISFSGYSRVVEERKQGTPYIASDSYPKGYVYSSTDFVDLTCRP